MLRFLLATAGASAVGLAMLPVQADAAPARHIRYDQWSTGAQLSAGASKGVAVAGGRITIATPVLHNKLGGTSYEGGSWTSPFVAPGFDLTELVPSWAADTPGNTWIRIGVRGRTASGASTGWDTIARWAARDRFVRRTSLGSQPDGGAKVLVDTWSAPAGLIQWQLRVALFRKVGTTRTPVVETIGGVASRLPSGVPATSRPTGVAAGKVLAVPRYSQMIHEGEYPEYGGGGEAWCSPTSTSMILGYYDRLPSAASYAWVDPDYRDRFVDHAARMTFDHSFDGTGNWPFNTAYAATRTGTAFVTRLRNLRDAERFVAAGIPVVASIAFGAGQLTGAPISSTKGHVLAIVGFTEDGDVVVNDPAAGRNKTVRRTYDRAQLEAAWLRKSGGLSYVISDGRPLPGRSGTPRW